MQNKKTIILALIALALFIIGYYPAFEILVQKWSASDEYSHAFLTVPIIFYMVWNKKDVFANTQSRHHVIGLVLLLLATVFYLFALLTQVHTVITLAMILAVFGTCIFLAGSASVKELLTPFILLLMLIPVPDQLYIQITFPLQLKVSQISEVLIRLFGVSIFREGNIMSIPGKSFEVVEACSGLRSMITLLTLSVIMGYYMLQRTSSKLFLVVASVPTAIMINIIRVVAMILLYHFFEIDLTEGTLHTIAGLMVFGVAMLILLLLQRVMEFWELKQK